ncbi:MAG TPA: Hsp70 family protein, partial [Acidobacteriaceae bacterium]
RRAIEGAVDSLFKETGVAPGSVDRVFLTGGSSFVPAVRRIFSTRFGEERVRTGEAFTSVAHGLALRGLG